MSIRAGRKRLSVDLPLELHEGIKLSADLRNITITKWIMRACYARIKKERILEDVGRCDSNDKPL